MDSVLLSAGLGVFTGVFSFHSPSSPKGLRRGNGGSERSTNLPKGTQLVHWRGVIGPHGRLILKFIYFPLYQWQILPCAILVSGALEFRSLRTEFLNCRLQLFKHS